LLPARILSSTYIIQNLWLVFWGLICSEDAGAPRVPSGEAFERKENEKVDAYSMRLENLLDAE